MVPILSPETISRRFFEGMYKVLLEITTSWFFCKRPRFRVKKKRMGPSCSRNPHQHTPSVKKKHQCGLLFLFLYTFCYTLFILCSSMRALFTLIVLFLANVGVCVWQFGQTNLRFSKSSSSSQSCFPLM